MESVQSLFSVGRTGASGVTNRGSEFQSISASVQKDHSPRDVTLDYVKHSGKEVIPDLPI